MCQYDSRCRVGRHRNQTVCPYKQRKPNAGQSIPPTTLTIPYVDESLFEISDELKLRRTYQTHSTRACGMVLDQPLKPVDGSTLHRLDNTFGLEKVSTWMRAYLRSAAEHLAAWADLALPYGHPRPLPGITRARPNMLMARAALESAAHALWPFSASSDDGFLARFAHLVITDQQHFQKALERGNKDTRVLDPWADALKARCESLQLTIPNRFPGYEKLVRHAATIVDEDEQRWSYLWNLASGAGHGQKWFTTEGHLTLSQTEYESGHYDLVTVANPVLEVEMIEASGTALLHGTVIWLAASGHDPLMVQEAVRKLSEYFPSKENPEPKPRPCSRVF